MPPARTHLLCFQGWPVAMSRSPRFLIHKFEGSQVFFSGSCIVGGVVQRTADVELHDNSERNVPTFVNRFVFRYSMREGAKSLCSQPSHLRQPVVHPVV